MIHWRVVLAVAPHQHQRYPTTGDWYMGGGIQRIVASKLGDEKLEFLIWVHELIEWFLCRIRGISEQAVTEFDTAHPDLDDPGADAAAPYHREHTFANVIMDQVAAELGVTREQLEAAEELVMRMGEKVA